MNNTQKESLSKKTVKSILANIYGDRIPFAFVEDKDFFTLDQKEKLRCNTDNCGYIMYETLRNILSDKIVCDQCSFNATKDELESLTVDSIVNEPVSVKKSHINWESIATPPTKSVKKVVVKAAKKVNPNEFTTEIDVITRQAIKDILSDGVLVGRNTLRALVFLVHGVDLNKYLVKAPTTVDLDSKILLKCLDCGTIVTFTLDQILSGNIRCFVCTKRYNKTIGKKPSKKAISEILEARKHAFISIYEDLFSIKLLIDPKRIVINNTALSTILMECSLCNRPKNRTVMSILSSVSFCGCRTSLLYTQIFFNNTFHFGETTFEELVALYSPENDPIQVWCRHCGTAKTYSCLNSLILAISASKYCPDCPETVQTNLAKRGMAPEMRKEVTIQEIRDIHEDAPFKVLEMKNVTDNFTIECGKCGKVLTYKSFHLKRAKRLCKCHDRITNKNLGILKNGNY